MLMRTLRSYYCQFVVSGAHFSMNFLLLAMQSVVCILCVTVSKRMGLITFRDFDMEDAKKWFPISFLLVCVIYTGSKSLVSLPDLDSSLWSLKLILGPLSSRSNSSAYQCTPSSRI